MRSPEQHWKHAQEYEEAAKKAKSPEFREMCLKQAKRFKDEHGAERAEGPWLAEVDHHLGWGQAHWRRSKDRNLSLTCSLVRTASHQLLASSTMGIWAKRDFSDPSYLDYHEIMHRQAREGHQGLLMIATPVEGNDYSKDHDLYLPPQQGSADEIPWIQGNR
jgi:hypothetical protein